MYIDEILDHFKCGKKIRRASWPTGVTISRNFDSINIKDLLADDWEVVEEKKKWWIPKDGQLFYFANSTLSIMGKYYNENDTIDKRRIAIGNCFQTIEQAQYMVEKLKVIHELEKFAYENNSEEIDWNNHRQEKYLVFYSSNKKEVCIDSVCFSYFSPFVFYFTREEIAKKAIETIGEERIKKYYFGIKEE